MHFWGVKTPGIPLGPYARLKVELRRFGYSQTGSIEVPEAYPDEQSTIMGERAGCTAGHDNARAREQARVLPPPGPCHHSTPAVFWTPTGRRSLGTAPSHLHLAGSLQLYPPGPEENVAKPLVEVFIDGFGQALINWDPLNNGNSE